MNSRIPMPLTRHSDDCWYDFHHSPDDKSEVQVRRRGEGGGLATDRPLDWLWLSSKLALYLLPAGPEIYLDPTPKRLTLQDREIKGKKGGGGGRDWLRVCRTLFHFLVGPKVSHTTLGDPASSVSRCGASTPCLRAAHEPKSLVPLGPQRINHWFSLN